MTTDHSGANAARLSRPPSERLLATALRRQGHPAGRGHDLPFSDALA